jgi:GNAT superfamily N-acetyltransferase
MIGPVRLAREADATSLIEIERSAALSFRRVRGLEWIADGPVLGDAVHLACIRGGTCWVAVDALDAPVGFLSAETMAGRELHIHEMSVALAFQRRGARRALLKTAIEWAVARDFAALTLTTFRDVPWNAPFYSRSGFEVLSAPRLGDRLASLLRQEVEDGFAEGARCAMRLSLGDPATRF